MNILSWFKPYWKYTDEELVERARKFADISDLIHAPLLIVLGAAVFASAGFGWWAINWVTELVQNSKDPLAASTAAWVSGLLGWILGQLVFLGFLLIYLRRERYHPGSDENLGPHEGTGAGDRRRRCPPDQTTTRRFVATLSR